MAGAGERVSSGLRAEPRLTRPPTRLHTDVPVIAAVNGAAVGWGMELALLADIRIAPERARFGELFVKRGLCCDVAGLGRLAGVIGRERAAELLFTGRIVGADEAAGMGLVSRVPHEDLLLRRAGPRNRDRAESPARRPDLKRARGEADRPAGAGRVGEPDLAELFRHRRPPRGRRRLPREAEPRYVGS